LCEAPDVAGHVSALIEREEINRVRALIPMSQHRRIIT
jgi:hypothetical protein